MTKGLLELYVCNGTMLNACNDRPLNDIISYSRGLSIVFFSAFVYNLLINVVHFHLRLLLFGDEMASSQQPTRSSPRKRVSSTLTQQVISTVNNKSRTPRANWDSFTSWIFLEVIAQVIEEEGQATNQLSRRQWVNMVGQMYTKAQMQLCIKQCQNRYNTLKKEWQAWQLLANAHNGATRIGWDPILRTYAAPDHFWRNLEAVRITTILH